MSDDLLNLIDQTVSMAISEGVELNLLRMAIHDTYVEADDSEDDSCDS